MSSRFIIIPEVLLDQEGLVILSDYKFWGKHQSELIEWCNERNVTVTGMTVVFQDKMTLTEFVLRWS